MRICLRDLMVLERIIGEVVVRLGVGHGGDRRRVAEQVDCLLLVRFAVAIEHGCTAEGVRAEHVDGKLRRSRRRSG